MRTFLQIPDNKKQNQKILLLKIFMSWTTPEHRWWRRERIDPSRFWHTRGSDQSSSSYTTRANPSMRRKIAARAPLKVSRDGTTRTQCSMKADPTFSNTSGECSEAKVADNSRWKVNMINFWRR